MPYWLVKFIGRADGSSVITCPNCRQRIGRSQAHNDYCSTTCADEWALTIST